MKRANVLKALQLCFLITPVLAAEISPNQSDWKALASRPTPPRLLNNLAVATAPGYPISNGGSHKYEYISSAILEKSTDQSMKLNVTVFLLNPSGCITANPCSAYDDSPEYVNAWVDWNGDKQWDQSELVMSEAGTGYKSISYYGGMFFSKSFSVPENAITGTTYCRVMLGWAYNPLDPTQANWTWGDVNDILVQITGEKPEIESITLTPEKNPLTQVDLSFQAKIKEAEGYEIVKVNWTGNDLPAREGNPFTFKYAIGKHGQKKVTATLTYKHKDSGIIGTTSKDHDFKLFFDKTGDDDNDKEPNWFKYWKQDGASTGLNNSLVVFEPSYGSGMYGGWNGKNVRLGAAAAEEHYPGKITITKAKKTFGGAKGIDCIEEVIQHELQHKTVSDNWKSNGIWNGLKDSDKGMPDSNCDDQLPDTYENTIGTKNDNTDTFDLEHDKDSQYREYGDQEYDCMVKADGAKGTAEKDWAYPGKQSDPPSNILLSKAQCSPQLSGPCKSSLAVAPDISRSILQTSSNYAEFLRVNSAQALDLDGSLLYDVLRLNLTVKINTPAYYEVIGWLEDSSANAIAWARNSGNFQTGTFNLDMDFSGPVIEESEQNGPYHLSHLIIRIGNEDENIVDERTDLFTTQLYSYDQFEPYTAKIRGNISEIVDNNNLKVIAELALSQPGHFTLSAELFDSAADKFLSRSDITKDFSSGIQQVDFLFSGSDLFYSKASGNYIIKIIQLRDSNNKILSAQSNLPTGESYKYSDFQTGEAAIAPASFQEQAIDLNNDNLFDGLMINFSASYSGTKSEQRFFISARLESAHSQTISSYSSRIILFSGNTSIKLFFPGGDIYKSGISGPYQLKNVTLISETSGNLVDILYDAYTTHDYLSEQFGKPPIEAETPFSDQIVDSNHDGLWDALEILIPLKVNNQGQVIVEGSLQDMNGDVFSIAQSEKFFDQPATQTQISLVFPGPEIKSHGVNGPYEVVEVSIRHAALPDQPILYSMAHKTSAYDYMRFEGKPPSRYSLALSADPSGGGTITKNPSPGTDGKYDSGTNVSLQANASTDYAFVNWSGDASGNNPSLVVKMDRNKTIVAHFQYNPPPTPSPTPIPRYRLSAGANNADWGSVLVSPAASSEGKYQQGSKVKITAQAARHYRFARWEGGASGSQNPLEVTMTRDMSVTAIFEPVSYNLALGAEPPAGGGIAASPAPGPGGDYTYGTTVTLLAEPGAHFGFLAWKGAAAGQGNPAQVFMDADKQTTATFALDRQRLVIEAAPEGWGSASASPAPGPDGRYDYGTTVTLLAAPAEHYQFLRWEGDAKGDNPTTQVIMTGDKTARALFKPLRYSIAMLSEPAGAGTITVDPAPGEDNAYDFGSTVTLRAFAGACRQFVRFEGSASGADPIAVVRVTAPLSVTAVFETTLHAISLETVPAGAGSIRVEPQPAAGAGGRFPCGGIVKFHASPAENYRFERWEGAVSGAANPSEIQVGGDLAVRAVFALCPPRIPAELASITVRSEALNDWRSGFAAQRFEAGGRTFALSMELDKADPKGVLGHIVLEGFPSGGQTRAPLAGARIAMDRRLGKYALTARAAGKNSAAKESFLINLTAVREGDELAVTAKYTLTLTSPRKAKASGTLTARAALKNPNAAAHFDCLNWISKDAAGKKFASATLCATMPWGETLSGTATQTRTMKRQKNGQTLVERTYLFQFSNKKAGSLSLRMSAAPAEAEPPLTIAKSSLRVYNVSLDQRSMSLEPEYLRDCSRNAASLEDGAAALESEEKAAIGVNSAMPPAASLASPTPSVTPAAP